MLIGFGKMVNRVVDIKIYFKYILWPILIQKGGDSVKKGAGRQGCIATES